MHFWVGSFCGILNDGSSGKPAFPRRVIAASDTIVLIEDMGNQIPEIWESAEQNEAWQLW